MKRVMYRSEAILLHVLEGVEKIIHLWDAFEPQDIYMMLKDLEIALNYYKESMEEE